MNVLGVLLNNYGRFLDMYDSVLCLALCKNLSISSHL